MSAAPKFSVIVPCCDVERWVGDCLASVRGQDFADFECIVVVETSRDGTESAVAAAIAGDGRFSMVSEPRSGSPATPRNTGLARARGEYVVFLDGDDELKPGALSSLAEKAARFPRADILAAAVERTDGWIVDNYAGMAETEMSGAEATVRLAGRTAFPRAMAFLGVFRRDFLERRGLRFADSLKHEDEEFSPRALYLAERVAVTHLAYYRYRMRAGSITAGAACSHVRDVAKAVANLAAFYASRSEAGDDVRRAWARMTLSMFDYALFGPAARATGDGELLAALDALYGAADGELALLLRHAGRVKRLHHAMIRRAWRTRRIGCVRRWFSLYYKALNMRRKLQRILGGVVP